MTNINLEDIRLFSFKKHKGQVRPNQQQEPKTVHIAQVAYFVKKAQGSDIAIAAAYLHDTIEDTDTTIQEVIDLFGKEIGRLVDDLTDPPDFVDMPLIERKTKQAQRILLASQESKLVKIADQLSNIISVYNDPPLDWDYHKCLEYIQGAKKIVDVCQGVNKYLEKEFLHHYQLGVEKYDNKNC